MKHKAFRSVIQNSKKQWININVLLTNFSSVQKPFQSKTNIKNQKFLSVKIVLLHSILIRSNVELL